MPFPPPAQGAEPTAAAAPLPPTRLAPTTIEWLVSESAVSYPAAIDFMERRVAAIRAGTAAEALWLLEHPPLYTSGTSALPSDLLDAHRFPIFPTGRGGRYTYHGPGQRVVYVMLDLKARGGDVRAFVRALEGWIIATLALFGVAGERRDGRVGIWVETPAGEAKIAALGVRVRRWVSYHGIAINVNPDLSHFNGIVPCGLAGYGVTSLHAQGLTTRLDDLDHALKQTFLRAFDDDHSRLIPGWVSV